VELDRLTVEVSRNPLSHTHTHSWTPLNE